MRADKPNGVIVIQIVTYNCQHRDGLGPPTLQESLEEYAFVGMDHLRRHPGSKVANITSPKWRNFHICVKEADGKVHVYFDGDQCWSP